MKPRPEFISQEDVGTIIAGLRGMMKLYLPRLPVTRSPAFLYRDILGGPGCQQVTLCLPFLVLAPGVDPKCGPVSLCPFSAWPAGCTSRALGF